MKANASGLEYCKCLIEASLGWGDFGSWTNEDFETLSDRIFDKTSVRLSVSTLKRIWGKVKYDSSPTTATLNALARFAGYAGWRDLLARETNGADHLSTIDTDTAPHSTIAEDSHAAPSSYAAPSLSAAPNSPAALYSPAASAPALATSSNPDPNLPESPPPIPDPSRPFITPIIILTLAFAALLSFISARIAHKPAAILRFEPRRTSGDLPNSVVFDYDAQPLHPQKVLIQQSWDRSRQEEVDPEGKQHTSIYYYPGYFNAKLIVDGEIKKRADVYIPSNGWKAIVARDPLPVYLSAKEASLDSGRLGINAQTLEAKTGSPVFSGRWVGFFDVHEFPGISGDHFLLRTTLRNTSTVEQSLCRNIRVTLMGKLNPIIIPLCDKGCISGLNIFSGSSAIGGKDHDLSAFGCDAGQWQQLSFGQHRGTLSIWLNGNLIYSIPENKSIGAIIGLGIAFEGTGEIKEAMLKGGGAATVDLLRQP